MFFVYSNTLNFLVFYEKKTILQVNISDININNMGNFTYEGLKSKNGSRCREKNVSKKFPEQYGLILEFKESNNLDLDFPQVLYLYLHNLTSPPTCKCENCNNPLSFESFNYGYKGTYCSTKCATNDEEYINNKKETVRGKYGVDYVVESKKVQNKAKQTIQDKYGVDNIMHLPETTDKIKKTMLDRYGVDNAMKLKEFSEKAIETNKQNNGGVHNLQKKENKDKRNKKVNDSYTEKYKDIDFIKSTGKVVQFYCGCVKQKICEMDRATLRFRHKNNIPTCHYCNPIDNSSYGEKTLQEYVQSIYNYEILLNDRTILSGKELDIVLPKQKLAIEYNGLYWHSDAKVNNAYHLNKTKTCNENGYSLLHVFEDEWIKTPEIVKSIIKNKLGLIKNRLYARKTELKEINTKEAKDFLNKNHIQGYVNSSYKFGLFFEDELVSVMTFGGLRLSLGQTKETGSYELLRFATKLNTVVIGGASKLYKYFLKKYSPKYVVSYANRRYFNGELYKNLGMDYVKETDVNYHYVKKSGDLYFRENRFKYRKDVLVKEGFDPNKSEREIMTDRGFLRIYDCGNFKYEKYY
jgi:hypothetical protein